MDNNKARRLFIALQYVPLRGWCNETLILGTCAGQSEGFSCSSNSRLGTAKQITGEGGKPLPFPSLAGMTQQLQTLSPLHQSIREAPRQEGKASWE